jgi:O-antigen ligase
MVETATPEKVVKQWRRWWRVGTLFVVLIVPLYFNPFADFPFRSSRANLLGLVVVIMVVGTVLIGMSRWRGRRPEWTSERTLLYQSAWVQNRLALPLLLLTTVYALATVTSIAPRVSVSGAGDRPGMLSMIVLLLLFFLASMSLTGWLDVERLISAIIIGSVPVVLYGWVQYVGLDPLEWRMVHISPVHSTFAWGTFLGAYLAMVIPYTVARLISQWPDVGGRFGSYTIILVLQLLCLLFTLSRGAWLALLAGIIPFLPLVSRRVGKASQLAIMGVVLLVALAVVAIFLILSVRGELIFGRPLPLAPHFSRIRAETNQARLVTWETTLTLIPERWLLGYGPATYDLAYGKHFPPQQFPELYQLRLDDPHNLFLYLATAVGLLGLLVFCWLILSFYQQMLAALRSQKSNQMQKLSVAAVAGGATAYLVQAQFSTDEIALATLFWLFLAMSSAMVRMVASEEEAYLR